MAFTGAAITVAALMTLELPGRTIRLCDGGKVDWGTETFASSDPLWGTVESVGDVSEGIGDSAPDGALTFLPATAAAASDLQNPQNQGSRLRFWLAEVNDMSAVTYAELVFDGLLDSTTLRLGRGSRKLDMAYMSRAERLFLVNEGNVLSSRFHQTVWPGELGLDNATNVPLAVPWGVEAPPRAQAAAGGAFGGGRGGGIMGTIGRLTREQ